MSRTPARPTTAASLPDPAVLTTVTIDAALLIAATLAHLPAGIAGQVQFRYDGADLVLSTARLADEHLAAVATLAVTTFSNDGWSAA